MDKNTKIASNCNNDYRLKNLSQYIINALHFRLFPSFFWQRISIITYSLATANAVRIKPFNCSSTMSTMLSSIEHSYDLRGN